MSRLELRDVESFRREALGGQKPAFGVLRASTATPVPAEDGSRLIRFVFSDDSIDRANDRIIASGWQLDDYNANPIALWGHDPSEPENIIGRGVNVGVTGSQLLGDIDFATAELNPLADMVYRLVKAKLLNAVSVGFDPLDYGYTPDKSRPGGIDFKAQALLEISVVPIPCNANALVVARGMGIDTAPMIGWAEKALDRGGMILVPKAELENLRRTAGAASAHQVRLPPNKGKSDMADFKVGAATDLPIVDQADWDGPAAAERIFTAAGFGGDDWDPDRAKRGFLVYDAASADLKGSFKLPFADIVDGELKASAAGIRAAASRLPDTDIPDDVKADARSVLDDYEARMSKENEDKTGAPLMLRSPAEAKALKGAKVRLNFDHAENAKGISKGIGPCLGIVLDSYIAVDGPNKGRHETAVEFKVHGAGILVRNLAGDRLTLVERSSGADTGIVIKDLWDVAWLAQLLNELGWVQSSSAFEEALEGDGSKVPQMLADILSSLGAVLIAMTTEEVGELVAAASKEETEEALEVLPADEEYVMAGATPMARKFRAIVAKARRGFAAAQAGLVAPSGTKAGRVLSSKNHAKLKDAHCLIKEVLDDAEPEDDGEDEPEPTPDPDDDATKARAKRVRKAKALALAVPTETEPVEGHSSS